MNKPTRFYGAALIAILAACSGSVDAQTVPHQRGQSHFIRTKSHVFNLDHIDFVDFNAAGDGSNAAATVFFAGREKGFTFYGEDAAKLRSAFDEKSSATPAEAAEPRPLAFDDFDGALGLNWKPVRPDPSHVSLTKNPGALTITTQRGTIHGEEAKDEVSEGIAAKNIYLIDNPLPKGADFVATTCVNGLTPAMPYQQAGLIVYNDDDNYLKLGYEFDWHKGEGQTFYCVAETDAVPEHHPVDGSESGLKRYWLRLSKRGNLYEYATSLDGKTFRVHGEVTWGDGAPKRIGILAKNGGEKDAAEADAAFEFFDLAPSFKPASTTGAKSDVARPGPAPLPEVKPDQSRAPLPSPIPRFLTRPDSLNISTLPATPSPAR